MELRNIFTFLRAVELGNFSKTAEALGYAQSTVTMQIQQLEEELGVQLFRRSKHRIILTEEGMLLRRRAEEIVSLADKTKDDLQHREDQLTGTIAVGSGELQSSSFLQPSRDRIRWSDLRFTAETPTTSKSASSGACWMWACCRSRWTSANTALSAHRAGSSGACWYGKAQNWPPWKMSARRNLRPSP